ncbi:CU044_5270 family protein [Streptomyces flavalbus]|uniref:CU044_5270 family protein n=1 Tax=Streptomyces flavalbus TaxID=2665155 RepID=A0ABW2VZH9_9ACTN
MNTHPRRRDQPDSHQDLAEMLPAPGRPVLAQDRHRVLKEHLMAHLTHESAHEPSDSPTVPERRRLGRRPVLVAVAVALAAVVGLGAVAVDGARNGKEGTATEATANDTRKATRLLDQIALAAAERPAVTVRDDQYVYTESQGSAVELGVDFTTVEELVRQEEQGVTAPPYEGAVRREEWMPVDGSRDGLRKGVAVDDPARRMDMAMGVGTGYLTYRQLEDLPTEPDALLKRLYGDAENVEPGRRAEVVIENVGVIIDGATLLPDLSAALYRAMAELPGARVVEHVKDAAGRAGVGLTFEGSPDGYAWVFDSSSLVYLGTTKTALLEVGVTDKKGEAPVTSP